MFLDVSLLACFPIYGIVINCPLLYIIQQHPELATLQFNSPSNTCFYEHSDHIFVQLKLADGISAEEGKLKKEKSVYRLR